MWEATTVRELQFDGDSVAGIRAAARGGTEISERTQIVVGGKVVGGGAFTAAHPTGCAVRVICALMFSQQGVASGEGAAQVVGEHIGV